MSGLDLITLIDLWLQLTLVVPEAADPLINCYGNCEIKSKIIGSSNYYKYKRNRKVIDYYKTSKTRR